MYAFTTEEMTDSAVKSMGEMLALSLTLISHKPIFSHLEIRKTNTLG